MQPRPPREPVAWRRWVEQMLTQFDVDLKRLQIVTPQIPDPEAGVPFSGPLDPLHFGGPGRFLASGSPLSGSRPTSGQGGTGGTNTGGTGDCTAICTDFAANLVIRVAGIAGTCSAMNGVYTFIGGPCSYLYDSGPSMSASCNIDGGPPFLTFTGTSAGISMNWGGWPCPVMSFFPLTLRSFTIDPDLCAGTDLSAATAIVDAL